jgi:hypothetical protein
VPLYGSAVGATDQLRYCGGSNERYFSAEKIV